MGRHATALVRTIKYASILFLFCGFAGTAFAEGFSVCSGGGKLQTRFTHHPTRQHCCIGASECRQSTGSVPFLTGAYCALSRTQIDCEKITSPEGDSLDFLVTDELLFLNPSSIDMRPELSPGKTVRSVVLNELQKNEPVSVLISVRTGSSDMYLKRDRTSDKLLFGSLSSFAGSLFTVRFYPSVEYRIFGVRENCLIDRPNVFVTVRETGIMHGVDCVIAIKSWIDNRCKMRLSPRHVYSQILKALAACD